MKIVLEQIKCPINYTDEDLYKKIAIKARDLGINAPIHEGIVEINKRALDARKKSDLKYVFTITLHIDEIKQESLSNNLLNVDINTVKSNKLKNPPVVVGTGPAGLFAALTLANEGLCPIVIERGDNIPNRVKAVEDFWRKGILSETSNVQFGEGGAGTFSDGKLVTGIKDPLCRVVLETFVKAGAPEDILYNAKPHIGTDLLRPIVINIRKYLQAKGAKVLFKTKLSEIKVLDGQIVGVKLLQETDTGILTELNIPTENVILAIGHSARDTFKSLHDQGLEMTPKPFSVGVRIEHFQEEIDIAMYGNQSGEIKRKLPSSEYKLSTKTSNNRSVYTFCMCPGGRVISSSSARGQVVTNGMSYNKRDGRNANSALLVNITPEDFGEEDVLAGFKFQEKLETLAFEKAGGNYFAPIQYVGDFLGKEYKSKLLASYGTKTVTPTYTPGVKETALDEILPDIIIKSLKESFEIFDRKIKGFANPNAVITGVETRSSSPVRISRDQNFQSNILGVYPCGEGAGYAGGIMSASVDGIKCAKQIIINSIN